MKLHVDQIISDLKIIWDDWFRTRRNFGLGLSQEDLNVVSQVDLDSVKRTWKWTSILDKYYGKRFSVNCLMKSLVGLIIRVVVGCLEQLLELMEELIMQYWKLNVENWIWTKWMKYWIHSGSNYQVLKILIHSIWNLNLKEVVQTYEDYGRLIVDKFRAFTLIQVETWTWSCTHETIGLWSWS